MEETACQSSLSVQNLLLLRTVGALAAFLENKATADDKDDYEDERTTSSATQNQY